jgi:hypothetical protein
MVAVILRLLLLGATGAATVPLYAASLFEMIGIGFGWAMGAVAAVVGASLGLGFGVLLGPGRR